MKSISVIVPVFNEAQNIEPLVEAIKKVFITLPYQYHILFVNDGSTDASFKILKEISAVSEVVKYISFSRNFGKDIALKAGLDAATADVAITIDADMQHPPELMVNMLSLWQQGYEVVYAHRLEKNKNTGFLNQVGSYLFYKIMNRLSDLNMEQGISDYRLLDAKVVSVLKSITETDLFLRGFIKWVGFRQIGIPYKPHYRFTGTTTYSKKKLIKLALRGLTSFSTQPLYAAAYMGFGISALSILYLPYALLSYYVGYAISGWVSVIVTIAFFGGLQLCILGIIGLYLGKVFMQGKNRPQYIIQETNLS